MSRLSRLALRDLETLSAYVDGTLSPAERQAVEGRLEQDPSLRQVLKEIRTTSALLRALPQVRPPHNFTLTPEMAGVRSGRLRTPFLQLATAVATLAFVITVGVDVLGGAMPGVALRAAAPAPEMAAEAPAELAAADALEAGTAATLAETAVAEKAVVEQTIAVAQAPLEAPAATPTAQAQVEEYASRAAPTVGGAAEAPPAPSEAAAAPMLGAEPVVSQECEACGPDLVLPTTAPEGMVAATAVPEAQWVTQEAAAQVVEPPAERPAPEARLRRGVPALRWLEIGLGAAALLLGGVTLWARRRAR
jgi:anti-sigma factor RsiW